MDNEVNRDTLESGRCTPELFCEVCGHYPIEPVHGHFTCPACHNITKCCEGMPLEA